jgi:hypothetical protein
VGQQNGGDASLPLAAFERGQRALSAGNHGRLGASRLHTQRFAKELWQMSRTMWCVLVAMRWIISRR